MKDLKIQARTYVLISEAGTFFNMTVKRQTASFSSASHNSTPYSLSNRISLPPKFNSFYYIAVELSIWAYDGVTYTRGNSMTRFALSSFYSFTIVFGSYEAFYCRHFPALLFKFFHGYLLKVSLFTSPCSAYFPVD